MIDQRDDTSNNGMRLVSLLVLHFFLTVILILYRYSPGGFSFFWFAWDKLAIVRIGTLFTMSFLFSHLFSFYQTPKKFEQYKFGSWATSYILLIIVGMAVLPSTGGWPYMITGGKISFFLVILGPIASDEQICRGVRLDWRWSKDLVRPHFRVFRPFRASNNLETLVTMKSITCSVSISH